MRLAAIPLVLPLLLTLGGCDIPGFESGHAVAARREAEGKAVGAACRHAGRAIEDCYVLNRKVDKAAIFSGWREMNDYMRENNIEAVRPEFDPADGGSAQGRAASDRDEEAASAPSTKVARQQARSKTQ